jgi:two-component system, LytTR family, sensor kinase
MQNTNTQFLGFNDTWFRLIMIPVISAFVPVIFFQIPFGNGEAYWNSFVISMFFTVTYWHYCRWIFIKMNRKYPSVKQNRARISHVLFYCFGFILFFCPFFHFVIEEILFVEVLQVYQKQYQGVYSITFAIYSANIVLFLAIAATYESIRNMTLWEKTSAEKEQLEKEHIASQLEGLKSQVNPHFLFNSLNTLISIIPEDSERSVRFVRQLSKIYRYFLETTHEKTVPLQQEMDFVHSYTFLLKERFGESLHLDIDDKNACEDCQIVPFSLQLLLENCIKHNIISQDKPLYINVLFSKNNIIVKNNLQLKNQIQEGAGVGLKNIENRYALLSNEKVIIEKNEKEFCVTLPLL